MSTVIDTPDQAERQIPAEAARFVADGMFQFATIEEGKEGVPVRLHARDAKPIAHWYWGKIAHDMTGVIHRDSLAIDWCHDWDQILGYVDQVSADAAKGLDLSGRILTSLDEKAAEIAVKAAAGVPYESSIDWNGPAVLEYVEPGMQAEVNGYTFEGPGYIARKWHLRGVAICPHGADMSTTTEFSAGHQVGVTVFTQTGKGVVMPTTKSPPTKDNQQRAAGQTTDNAPPETPTPAGAAKDSVAKPDPQSQKAATVDAAKDAQPDLPVKPAIPAQKFVDAFGPQLGYRFYGDGLSYEDAAVEFGKAVCAERDALAEECRQLKEQVVTLRAAAGTDAVSATPEGGKPQQDAEPAADANLAKFKSGIKLPGRES
jgi:hypothetical protein